MKNLAIIFLLSFLISGCMGAFGEYEIPKYNVILKQGSFEVREYQTNLVAEVEVSGERDEAASNGFKLLADFIFGNNAKQQDIKMTSPVVQEKKKTASEKISMTAPVVQQKSGESWKIKFIMPSEYTLETLPKPINDKVKIYQDKPKKYAVIRFSGSWRQAKLNDKNSLLEDFIKQNKLIKNSEVIYNFYNPPFTLPFLRRNEIMFEVKI